MKKSFKIVYTILFFTVCCLPLVLMPFFKNDASIEKRELTRMPSYLSEGRLNIQFSDQFESWFNDALPLRAYLLTGSNLIKGELLHASTSNVIVGKEGWLFFASESADYMNTSPMTDQQVQAVSVTLSLLQEQIENRGGHFTFVPVPNKSSVYGEYMPSNYQAGETSNLDRITETLKKDGVSFTDMKAVMMAEKEDFLLYHARDSHWNYRGAIIGYRAVMDSLGRPYPAYEDAAYTIEKTWRGDLDKLLYPVGGFMDDQVVFDIDHASFRFLRPQGASNSQAQLQNFMSDREDKDDYFVTKNTDLSDGSSLLMVRDSFGRALLPFMIDCYETATFRRTDVPDLANLAEGTDFVYEIAERNLIRVIETAPFMYAPKREGITADTKCADLMLEAVADTTGYGRRIYGALPDDLPMGDGRVYLVLEQDGTEQIYEAFPIYEAKLLGGEGTNGFSALHSDETGLEGTCRLSVIIGGIRYYCNDIIL